MFIQAPLLAQQLKDMIEQSTPSKHDLLGPVTLFQRDMDWLSCRFSPDVDAISNEANECILFTEPDKKKFEHFIREQISIWSKNTPNGKGWLILIFVPPLSF